MASGAPSNSVVSYDVIKAAAKALRFCVQYQSMVDELAFRNCAYNGEGSEIKYDQVLQALVNVNLGTAALSLEEQLSRGVASLSGFISSGAQAQAELAEILATEEVWQKKLSYAEMNPTTTETELKSIRLQIQRLSDAREELQERINAEKAKAKEEEDEEEPVPELSELEKAQLKAETAQALADRLQEQLDKAVSDLQPFVCHTAYSICALGLQINALSASWRARRTLSWKHYANGKQQRKRQLSVLVCYCSC